MTENRQWFYRVTCDAGARAFWQVKVFATSTEALLALAKHVTETIDSPFHPSGPQHHVLTKFAVDFIDLTDEPRKEQ